MEWIRVEDRLPDVMDEVLVCYNDDCDLGLVTLACFMPDPDDAVRWQNMNGWGLDNVSHWMPLPEPPGGGNADG